MSKIFCFSEQTVRLGSLLPGKGRKYNVAEVNIHPEHSRLMKVGNVVYPQPLFYDATVLELDERIEFSTDVQKVRFALDVLNFRNCKYRILANLF